MPPLRASLVAIRFKTLTWSIEHGPVERLSIGEGHFSKEPPLLLSAVLPGYMPKGRMRICTCKRFQHCPHANSGDSSEHEQPALKQRLSPSSPSILKFMEQGRGSLVAVVYLTHQRQNGSNVPVKQREARDANPQMMFEPPKGRKNPWTPSFPSPCWSNMSDAWGTELRARVTSSQGACAWLQRRAPTGAGVLRTFLEGLLL